MPPRIAIPVPHSGDHEYAERSLPQYERAVEMAGGEPIRIPLDQPPAEVMKLIERCDGVLLPGSKADVNPEIYTRSKHEKTAAPDSKRYTVDELLLQDAFNMRKPVLGICYGMQSLNVHRTGTLVQHIESPVNHAAGRNVSVAHTVEVDPMSKLAAIVTAGAKALSLHEPASPRLKPGASTVVPSSLVIEVNSSHHQAAEVVGDGLRVVARCPQDGVIEAMEGTSPDHFVLAVQWHPERSVDDEPSRAIFRALVEAARARQRV
jgi:putative glutamine amidotransferase